MSRTRARLLLAAVLAARGISFLFNKELVRSMTPMSVMAVRFLMAFVILAFIFHKKLRTCDRNSLRGGVVLGILYSLVVIFDLYALRSIDSGVAALIENMAIVLVPIAAAALGRTFPKKKAMLCALLAVAGVGFLSLAQPGGSGSGFGIVLAIFAALAYTACILATERVSRHADPVSVGVIQMGTMGLVGLAASLCSGGIGMPQTGRQWVMMLILVLICSCFGFTFQPVAQKYLSAEEAAELIVINPLTASLVGILVAHESVSAPKIIGYILILSSLFLYNIRAKQPAKQSRRDLDELKKQVRAEAKEVKKAADEKLELHDVEREMRHDRIRAEAEHHEAVKQMKKDVQTEAKELKKLLENDG